MADLSITMHGDASGAAGALQHVGHEASALHEILEGALKGALGSTVTTFSALETAAEKAAEVVKDFFKESIEDYARAEKASNQLRAAAGSLTGAFQEQAEAMSRSLKVKVADVEHMQMMLLRYGAAPSQIEATTTAVLNFAAATGQDANSALMMMIRGVENGTGSLGRMGVSFKATGDFTKDLAAATDVLNSKFGGAAATDAAGLGGRAHGVSLAMEGLRETIGAMFDDVDKRTHLLDNLAKAINNVNDAVKKKGLGGALKSFARGGDTDEAQVRANVLFDENDPAWQERLADARTRDAAGRVRGDELVGMLTKAGAIPAAKEEEGLPDKPLTENDEKEKTKKAEFHKSMLQLEADYQRKHQNLLIENYEKELKDEQEHDDKMLEAKAKLEDAVAAMQHEALKRADESSLEATKQMLKEMKEQQDDIAKLNDVFIERIASQKQMWANAGMQVGQAFADALGKAIEGGAEDTEQTMLDLVSSLLTIAGGIIGSIAGEGNPYASQAGSMLGMLAGKGITAAYKANKKHHEGGWIERYHSGGWPALGGDEQMIIAQTGERVLSRQQVHNMGGPGAVDAAARGGGAGLHVHVNAIDTRSSREFFENDGGRGFYNALRTGRGSLTPLLTGAR